ncbi:hypothetical protein OQA88_3564 [Cercophora sp. LCS_1]
MVGMLNPPTAYQNYEGLSMNLDVGVGVGVGNPMSQSYAPAPGLAAADANTALAVGDDQGQPLQTADEYISPNRPGGGPRPSTMLGSTATALAANSGSSTSSMGTLTEFTKRRNWPARVVEELRDMIQLLDAEGKIKYASPSVETLTGYTADELREKFLPDLMHPDDIGVFKAEFNEAIARGTQFRIYYRLKHKDGTWKIFESTGHPHIAAAKFAPNPNNQKAFCQAVFVMSRPYPTQATGELDKFLESKLEHERLSKKIQELRDEEMAEETADGKSSLREGLSETTPSETTATARGIGTPYASGMDSATSPTHLTSPTHTQSSALTRENLERMTRRDGSDHLGAVQLLTGTTPMGDRNRNAMAGKGSPMTIRGDAGIAIPVDRDPRTGEKKKKQKVAEEYVCNDCGTLESPEWRKGPGGPKSLCNACGLRWAKREKKKNANAGVINQDQQPSS